MQKAKSFLAVLALSLLLGVALPAPGQAAPLWRFDPPHCTIMFQIRHLLGKVPGYFEKYHGEVAFAPYDLAHSRITLSIETASVNTRIKQRDDHLRSADFFDADRYPQMTFGSTSIRSLGGNQFVALGRLTIKDVTKDVELPFTFLGSQVNPKSKTKDVIGGFEGRLTLDRLAFHVGTGKFFDMGVLDKMVEITFSLEMIQAK